VIFGDFLIIWAPIIYRKMNAAIPESKGVCQRCGEHIAFPAAMQGESVSCPHCGKETTLVASISPSFVHKISSENALEAPTIAGARPVFLIYVIAFLIPIVGFFLGVWLVAKKEASHGAAVMILSVVLFLIYLAVWSAANQ
jgi:predicted RNA-binding Zn-ribbon protein involved in translation (DUF1610 family)